MVFGGTGYTGGNVVREAASRGHEVIAVSRSEPKEPVPGVRYEIGGLEEVAPQVVPGADVVVAALSPRGDMAGRLVDAYEELARLSAEAGARYLQVGGFSSRRRHALHSYKSAAYSGDSPAPPTMRRRSTALYVLFAAPTATAAP